jgi:hypothetical protein
MARRKRAKKVEEEKGKRVEGLKRKALSHYFPFNALLNNYVAEESWANLRVC